MADAHGDGPITGVVIAGGSGRRMGADKRVLAVDGVPMLRRVLEAVASVADDLVVSCRREAPPPPSVLGSLGARLVFDARPDHGPLVGVEAALGAARCEIVLVVAGDLPWVEPAVLRMLVDEVRAHPEADAVAIGTDWGPQPLLAGYRRRALAAATRQLDAGDRRMRAFLAALDVRVIPPETWHRADPSGRSALNANVPEDLA